MKSSAQILNTSLKNWDKMIKINHLEENYGRSKTFIPSSL